MSRFLSGKFRELEAYVPGEQPRGGILIKLNTNENPYPPHPSVAEAVRREAEKLNLYNDPDCGALREILAARLGIRPEELLMTNGSDEILNFAFLAFCDAEHPACFADITYCFYPVYAQVNLVPFRTIPLRADFTIAPEDYFSAPGPVFIANPNAPTGLALKRDAIRSVLEANPDRIVVVDEAYVDFGSESCVPLIREYDNLLVTQTFSKFRSMAGLRLGFGAACEALIRDLKTMQYSTNPYNVDRLTQAAGVACLKEDGYNQEHARMIAATRDRTAETLRTLGFEMTDSRANFLFVRHPAFPGDALQKALRQRGILIRHFNEERIRDYSRITVGTPEQMDRLTEAIRDIMEEQA